MSFREIYKKGLDSVRLSGGKSAWGLEIGDSGLKAVKASARDRELYIEAIDRIDYSSIEHEITSKKPDRRGPCLCKRKGRGRNQIPNVWEVRFISIVFFYISFLKFLINI